MPDLPSMEAGAAPAEITQMMTYVDPVYGEQRFPAIVQAIIETPQFQRLRNIKQLGVCNYVFRGADHTRYEHCLGVCHLVIRYLQILETNSAPDIRTDEFYKLCVILAGLLHDIGHGPFSHMWEPFVRSCGSDTNWAHEDTSCAVVAHLFASNDIRLSADAQRHADGVRLIGALIRGDDGRCSTIADLLGDELHYLAEIVNNKYCLIDVDKWDYMVRDAHHLRETVHIDRTFEECFRRSCVLRLPREAMADNAAAAAVDRRTHIAFSAADSLAAVRALFAMRAHLHRECYQHRAVVGVEMVLRRVFQLAEEAGFRFHGHKLTDCHRDMLAFQHLDDSILQRIEAAGGDQRLQAAQQLAHQLRHSQFSVVYEEATQKVGVKMATAVSNNNNDGEKWAELVYQLQLPDGQRSMPDRLIVFGDDGVKVVNPKTYSPRS